jgi:hypothetical protein
MLGPVWLARLAGQLTNGTDRPPGDRPHCSVLPGRVEHRLIDRVGIRATVFGHFGQLGRMLRRR